MKLLLFFLALLLIKFSLNAYYLWRTKFLYQLYVRSFNESSKSKFNSLEYASEIKKIILKAGIKDSFIAVTQPTGYFQIATFKASVLDNIFNDRLDFVEIMNSKFRDAMGIYKHRIFECINPIYWVELVINLPRSILEYLGVNTESAIIKLSSLVYWIFGAIYAIFMSEINNAIKAYLSNFLK